MILVLNDCFLDACPSIDYIGDHHCNDFCNTRAYNFDGGDCCSPQSTFAPYCAYCQCHISEDDFQYLLDDVIAWYAG